jgi:hypothetical protein
MLRLQPLRRALEQNRVQAGWRSPYATLANRKIEMEEPNGLRLGVKEIVDPEAQPTIHSIVITYGQRSKP